MRKKCAGSVRHRTEFARPAHYIECMDWHTAAADWPHFRSEVRARWRYLTEAQLDAIAGGRERLAVQLAASNGLSANQVEQQISRFEASNASLRPVSAR